MGRIERIDWDGAGAHLSDRLVQLHTAGKSASEIAAAIGLTKGAVSGRITRLQRDGVLQKRGPTGKPRSSKKATPGKQRYSVGRGGTQTTPRGTKSRQISEVSDLPLHVPGVEPIGVWDLTSGTCRAPLWPAGPVPPIHAQRFCGGEATQGTSWCDAHARMFFEQPKEGDES